LDFTELKKEKKNTKEKAVREKRGGMDF